MEFLHYLVQGLGLFAIVFIVLFMLAQYLFFRFLDRPFRKSGRVRERLDRENMFGEELPERESVLDKTITEPERGSEIGPLNSDFQETISEEMAEPSNWFNPKRRLALWARRTLWGAFYSLCTLQLCAISLILHILGYIHIDLSGLTRW